MIMFSLKSNFCCVCNAFYLFLFKMFKDGNDSVSSQISAGFESSGFRFGNDFSSVVFEFGPPKPIGFGFGFLPLDTHG